MHLIAQSQCSCLLIKTSIQAEDADRGLCLPRLPHLCHHYFHHETFSRENFSCDSITRLTSHWENLIKQLRGNSPEKRLSRSRGGGGGEGVGACPKQLKASNQIVSVFRCICICVCISIWHCDLPAYHYESMKIGLCGCPTTC